MNGTRRVIPESFNRDRNVGVAFATSKSPEPEREARALISFGVQVASHFAKRHEDGEFRWPKIED